jgi:hypothetical protein
MSKPIPTGLLLVGAATCLMGCLPTYGQLYLAGAAVITLIAVYFMRETKGIDLATVDEADREDLARTGVA